MITSAPSCLTHRLRCRLDAKIQRYRTILPPHRWAYCHGCGLADACHVVAQTCGFSCYLPAYNAVRPCCLPLNNAARLSTCFALLSLATVGGRPAPGQACVYDDTLPSHAVWFNVVLFGLEGVALRHFSPVATFWLSGQDAAYAADASCAESSPPALSTLPYSLLRGLPDPACAADTCRATPTLA